MLSSRTHWIAMLAAPSSTSAFIASSSPYLHSKNHRSIRFFITKITACVWRTSTHSGEEPMSLCLSRQDPYPAGGTYEYPRHLLHTRTCELETSLSSQAVWLCIVNKAGEIMQCGQCSFTHLPWSVGSIFPSSVQLHHSLELHAQSAYSQPHS